MKRDVNTLMRIEMSELDDVKIYLRFMKYDTRRILLVVVLSLLYAIFDGVSLGTLIPLLQSLDNNGSSGGVVWDIPDHLFNAIGIPLNFSTLLFMIFMIFGIRQIIGHFRRKYQYGVAYDFILKLRYEFFENVIRSDMRYFNNTKVGKLINSLVVEANIAGSGFIIMIELLNTFLILSIYGILLIAISWQMTLISVVIILITSIILNYRVKISKKIRTRIIDLNNELNSHAVESFSGIHLIKSSVTA